jgi:hypothetical protein
VLYAVDATSMRLLWRSTAAQLDVGGKYSHPVVAHGVVMVATDRVQAFGLRGAAPAASAVDRWGALGLASSGDPWPLCEPCVEASRLRPQRARRGA